ncbi:MAG: DUF3450 family protein [Verrucomicrobiae bacterium]|nr:DUF3450 family protein [Verrucomicrobiae bacterium]
MLGLSAVLVTGASPSLRGDANPVEDARATLAKWVETRQMIARLKSDWAQDRETLESTIALFDSQKERLDASLAKLGTDNAQVTKEIAENEALLKNHVAALDRVEGLVAGYEKRLKAAVPNFPPPLMAREQVSKILSLVPADPDKTEAQLISRVQNLILILKAVQEFNGDLHLESEIRSQGEREVQVQTLYLGLGQAWFVNADGTFAGTGGPSPEGWAWKENSSIAPQVRQAIGVYEKSQPAVYVALPAEVK